MQCILYKIYFWKVFHMYYKLICILYALLCGQKKNSYKKWVLHYRGPRRVYITDLVKSVTHEVVSRRPSHVAGRPRGPASTDFWLWIPCYRLLDSVTEKPTRERPQSGAGWPRGLTDRPPPRPTGKWPLHTASSCQVHSRGDTYFGGIPNFLVIS
jgi:hypothetical protein